MAGSDNSLGYLRQINEKMDRLLAIAERYVGIPVAVELAAEPSAEEAPAAAAEKKARAPLTQEQKAIMQAGRAKTKMEKNSAAAAAAEPAAAAAAEPAAAAAAEPAAAAAAEPAAAAAAKPRIPIVRSSVQGYARMLRRTLEKGVADPSARAKLEKDLRELQPKIDAEIAAGIPLESEFQSQYDSILLYLKRDLKPDDRARAESTRNSLKIKLNAEQAALAGARGGTRKRKGSKKTKSRRNY